MINIPDRKLICSSAMHPSVLLYDENNKLFAKAGTEQIMIGAFDDTEYENREYDLPDNTRLFLFSDGTYEIFTGEGRILNLDNLAKIIEYNLPNGNAIDNTYAKLKEINKNNAFDDDYTMIELIV